MSYRSDPYDPKQVALLDPAALDDALAAAQKAFAGAGDVDGLTALKPSHLGDRSPVSLARREIGALPTAGQVRRRQAGQRGAGRRAGRLRRADGRTARGSGPAASWTRRESTSPCGPTGGRGARGTR